VGVRRGRSAHDQRRPWPVRSRWVWLALPVVSALVWTLARGPVDQLWLWIPVIAMVSVGAVEACRWGGPWLLWRASGRRRPKELAASVVAVAGALALAVTLGFAGRWAIDERLDPPPLVQFPAVPCDPAAPPDELRIVTARSQLTVTRQLVDAYEQDRARGGCDELRSYVYAPPSTEALLRELAADWAGGAPGRAEPTGSPGPPASTTLLLGPRPDIWVPGSRAEVDAVQDAIGAGDLRLAGLIPQVVGWSPIVLAVSESAAGGVSVRRTGHESLRELLATEPVTQWGLVRPEPAAAAVSDLSPVGDLVNAAVYGPVDGDAEATQDAREFERTVVQTADEHGYPLGDVDGMLCRHRQLGDDANPTGLLVTEQAVVRFNRGDDQLDQACQAAGLPATGPRAACGTRQELAAIYSTEPYHVAYEVVRLSWQPPGTRPARAAEEFQAWLSSRPGRAALVAAGLRPQGSPPDQWAGPAGWCGALPDALAETGYRASDQDRMEAVRTAYGRAKVPGRVLIALDVSGSMAEPVGDGGSRYEIATEAVRLALGRLGGRDEVGLWVFPGDGDSHREIQELARVSSPDTLDRVTASLAAEPPDGPNTPLYATIAAGVAHLRGLATAGGEAESADGERITALVVVTDGEDTASTPTALVGIGRADGVRVYVVAVQVEKDVCNFDQIAGVTSRTNGDCRSATFETLEQRLGELFGTLWSGDGNGPG
jgi:Ca-activated chloride channel homolog